MGEVFGYLLTWTCYGTWLHGDKRGSVDRFNACHVMDYCPPDPSRQRAMQKRMASKAVRLSPDQRRIVRATIVRHCGVRQWHLFTLRCLSNHVHVVVRACDATPERVLSQLKAYATRELRAAGMDRRSRVWTEHGSTRYLKTRGSLNAAIRYVENQ